jgi:hypothetical protein
MFQANYQYTPLKEYAAMKNLRSTNETNTNGYQSKYLKKEIKPLSFIEILQSFRAVFIHLYIKKRKSGYTRRT